MIHSHIMSFQICKPDMEPKSNKQARISKTIRYDLSKTANQL